MAKQKKKVDLSKISFILMDLDGVMSDGSLIYTPEGERLKVFSVYDGFGIERGRIHGLKFGVITGKTDEVNRQRAKRLKLDELYEGIDDKPAAFDEIRKKYNLKAENFCFIGDDVFDLPLLRAVGFSCAPANAMDEVKKQVHYVTKREGGKGAVREVIDYILSKQGKI
jgi:3-deoxy-D-manno-octulosonate 8-phosphate phosphatase (KDO 8-P phosphatase)